MGPVRTLPATWAGRRRTRGMTVLLPACGLCVDVASVVASGLAAEPSPLLTRQPCLPAGYSK